MTTLMIFDAVWWFMRTSWSDHWALQKDEASPSWKYQAYGVSSSYLADSPHLVADVDDISGINFAALLDVSRKPLWAH